MGFEDERGGAWVMRLTVHRMRYEVEFLNGDWACALAFGAKVVELKFERTIGESEQRKTFGVSNFSIRN